MLFSPFKFFESSVYSENPRPTACLHTLSARCQIQSGPIRMLAVKHCKIKKYIADCQSCRLLFGRTEKFYRCIMPPYCEKKRDMWDVGAKNEFFAVFFAVKGRWFRKLILILRTVCGRRACWGSGSQRQTKKARTARRIRSLQVLHKQEGGNRKTMRVR